MRLFFMWHYFASGEHLGMTWAAQACRYFHRMKSYAEYKSSSIDARLPVNVCEMAPYGVIDESSRPYLNGAVEK